jgi:hypothetical protein
MKARSIFDGGYQSLPRTLRLYLTNGDFDELAHRAEGIECDDKGTLTKYPICNGIHHDLWSAATNPECSRYHRRVIRKFVMSAFPHDYLEVMEEFRPLDINRRHKKV